MKGREKMTKDELIDFLKNNDDISAISFKETCKVIDGEKVIKLESIKIHL
jgi:TFIIF-interacting CTD phosphatase-like protein